MHMHMHMVAARIEWCRRTRSIQRHQMHACNSCMYTFIQTQVQDHALARIDARAGHR